MQDKLFIRSYSQKRKGHAHNFYQLVLPIRGVINIEVDTYSGKVAPGECVVINQNQVHHFTANSHARFVVADMCILPPSLLNSKDPVFSITPPLICYLSFIEKQLQHQVNPKLEQAMLNTFVILLEQQGQCKTIDRRLRFVVEHILENIGEKLVIETLAKIAFLSQTQFKKLFKAQLGTSVSKYITRERMERAQALLMHTDYPVQLIAEQVGYANLSAFSRRFSDYYGFSPRHFNR